MFTSVFSLSIAFNCLLSLNLACYPNPCMEHILSMCLVTFLQAYQCSLIWFRSGSINRNSSICSQSHLEATIRRAIGFAASPQTNLFIAQNNFLNVYWQPGQGWGTMAQLAEALAEKNSQFWAEGLLEKITSKLFTTAKVPNSFNWNVENIIWHH